MGNKVSVEDREMLDMFRKLSANFQRNLRPLYTMHIDPGKLQKPINICPYCIPIQICIEFSDLSG